jgi:ABC-type bacteriocin/lantibiotic exporter with double-glycine peptidase domain
VKPVDLLDLGGFRRTPFVEQAEAAECGLACLAMVAAIMASRPTCRRFAAASAFH